MEQININPIYSKVLSQRALKLVAKRKAKASNCSLNTVNAINEITRMWALNLTSSLTNLT
tara:strand:- start:7350 stop:7529 length:180 start_codon:yes stop_codon:yes gene_type:complete